MFTTDYTQILELVANINPEQYGKTRNYLNGAVTKLSPYISRGVISTKQVASSILAKGYQPHEVESLLKELAWRDYFQQVWMALGEGINTDIKKLQPHQNKGIPKQLVDADTGIIAIDQGIEQLYQTGYMHNHLRMYVASLACNVAQSHWQLPAKWMYYHLLDADWASNALSWQWVAGSFSAKKYYANQENINKYCGTEQTNTFLDASYEKLMGTDLSKNLPATASLPLTTTLPQFTSVVLEEHLPTYVYNFYNLDPTWDNHVKANRVLLLEPQFFDTYPVKDSTIAFVLELAKNIPGIQVYTGSFSALFNHYDTQKINYKQHPTNNHYQGIMHSRDWMFPSVTGYYHSFFAYWKKASAYLNQL